MYILGIILFVIILVIVGIDYFKIDRESRRCPQCNNIVKLKFDLKRDKKQFSISPKNGQKSNVTIYKCDICGSSWNHTYEIEENVT